MASTIERVADGLWWPSSPDGREIARRPQRMRDAQAAADIIAQLVPAHEHRVVIQAGGHIGLWPMALSMQFARVITFEPDIHNYACMVRNVKTPNVLMLNAAVSDQNGMLGQMARTKAHLHLSGAGYVVPGESVLCMTIDKVTSDDTDRVSAIVLDIEGGEYKALEGALNTLVTYAPLVVVEAGMFTEREGARSLIDIELYLRQFGYGKPARLGVGKHNYVFEVL